MISLPTEPEPEEPKVYVTTNRYIFSNEAPDISVYVSMDVDNADFTEELYDIYIVIRLADGSILFDSGPDKPELTTEVTPYLSQIQISDMDAWYKTLEYVFTDAALAGDYFVHIAAVNNNNELVAEDHVYLRYIPNYSYNIAETRQEQLNYEAHEVLLDAEQYHSDSKSGTNTEMPQQVRTFATDESIEQLADKLTDDGFPIFKRALQAYNVLSMISDGNELTEYHGDLIYDCSLTETEIDTLFTVKMIEIIFNNVSLFGDVDLTGAVKSVADIYKRKGKILAAVDKIDVVLDFQHDEWFEKRPRDLNVTVEAMYYFAGFQGMPEKYYHNMGEGQRFSQSFEVDSKSQYTLKNLRAGIYLLTATDTKDLTIRRKMLSLDRPTIHTFFSSYKVGFNYRNKVKNTSTSGLGCVDFP